MNAGFPVCDESSDGCNGGCVWSTASMDACEGSRSEASMSAKVGSCVCNEGGGGIRLEDKERASQAAFSSSRLT